MADQHKETIGYIAPEPIKKGFLGIGRKQSEIKVQKGVDGLRWQFVITSTATRDRDGEIITTKALEDYVAKSWPAEDKCLPENDFMFWHHISIGDVVYCETQGPILWEVAKERVGTFEHEGQTYPISAIWDYIEQHPEEHWGASHGFKYVSGDRDDGVYEWIDKFETSILPLRYAANPYTFSGVIDMEQKDHRGAFLDKLLGRDGVADKLRKAPTALESALSEAGIQTKAAQTDAAPAATGDPAANDPAPAPDPAANDPATAMLNALWAVIEANNQKEGVTTEQVKQQMMAAIQEQMAGAKPADPAPAAKALATDSLGQLANPMDAVKLLTQQNAELVESQGVLAKGQDDMTKALGALAPLFNSIAPLADSVKSMNARLQAVEAQLSGRPRIASQDEITKVDQSKLSPELKKSMQEYETFLGLPVTHQPK